MPLNFVNSIANRLSRPSRAGGGGSSLIVSCCLATWWLAAMSGCASFRKPPVSESMVQARQLSLRGTDAMQHGHLPQAEQLFRSAIETCPANDRARAGYAETLWGRNAFPEAIQQMDEAVRLSGGDPELLVRLGEMHLARGNLEAASQRCDAAIKSQRQLPAAWALRGDVLKARGQLDEALTSYHRALGYQEHYPRVQIAISEVYRAQNNPIRALATLEHLNDRFAPGQTPADVAFLRGLAFKALGRYDDAIESLAMAAKQDAAPADVFFHLGESQMLAGDHVSARSTLQQALSKAPTHEASQRLAAHLDSEQQRLSVAERTTR